MWKARYTLWLHACILHFASTIQTSLISGAGWPPEMARPPLPLGSHSTITTTADSTGRFRAQCRYRTLSGQTMRVERRGPTAAAAKRALQAALVSLAEQPRGAVGTARTRAPAGRITASMRVEEAAAIWLASIRRRRRATTADNYTIATRNLVLAELGALRVHEMDVPVLDAHMDHLAQRGLGPHSLRKARMMLSGVLSMAVRHEALHRNPVRELAPIEGHGRAPRALTAAEIEHLLAVVDADELAVGRRMPLLLRLALGTGLRLGELLGLRWCDVDLEAATLAVTGNIVPVVGQGLQRNAGKTSAARRELSLPPSVVERLKAHRAQVDAAAGGAVDTMVPVFATRSQGWISPSLGGRWIRDARELAGPDYAWVTLHTLRRTAATLLDSAGMSARMIADQLGHAMPSMTQDHYMGRGQLNRVAADVLDRALRGD